MSHTRLFFRHRLPFHLSGMPRFMVLQFLIAAMTNILSLALPIMMLQVYDRIIPHQAYSTLLVLTAGVVVALACDGVLRTIRAWLTGWITSVQEHAASCTAVARLCHADMGAFNRQDTGTHLQNMTAISRLREFYSGQALTALVDLPFVVIFLGLIVYLGHILVLVPATLLGLFLIAAVTSGNQLKRALERRAVQDNRKASYLVTILTGIHTVKAFAMEKFSLRGFEQKQSLITREIHDVALASGQSTLLGAAFGQLSIILTATAGVLLALNNEISVGGLSACTLLAGRTIQPVQRVLGTWLRLQDIAIAHSQAEALFALPVRARSSDPIPSLRGHILCDRLSFTHEDDVSPILKSITLDIQPGEVIALSGDKGSGKSTLLQLIAGLLPPTSGTVQIDGLDPAVHDPAELARQIAYLPPRATIFKGTLLDNLTGFHNDPIQINAAQTAAAQLGLDSIVNTLPRGYQTLLADSPADPVPPGVKQRIALARTLLHDPPVLLFDDADRALDKEGYNRLFRLIGRLKGRSTIIMVSQDQNLLSFADRSCHLADGVVTQREIQTSQHLSFLTYKARGQAA